MILAPPQVIDFTNQDAEWATGAAKWFAAQGLGLVKFAYRPAPSDNAWTYPISGKKAGGPVTIALFSDWASGGRQVGSVGLGLQL